jgi:hypothetical protein
VAEPTRRMEIKHPRPGSRLCVAVCHGNRTGLLQRQDIVDVWRIYESVDQKQLGRPRVAKDVTRALAPENFKKDRCASTLIPLIRHDPYSFASAKLHDAAYLRPRCD